MSAQICDPDRERRLLEVGREVYPNSFGGVWVDHSPTFKIIVAFTGEGDRKAFLDRLPAKSRRYVQIRNATKSLAAAQQDVDQILQALSAAKIVFETYFEPRSQNYVVTVKDQSAAGTARALIPAALRSMVNIRVGPVTETFQTNARSGDQIYGAWDLLDSSGQPTCTYGFVAGTAAAGIRSSPPAIAGRIRPSSSDPPAAAVIWCNCRPRPQRRCGTEISTISDIIPWSGS